MAGSVRPGRKAKAAARAPCCCAAARCLSTRRCSPPSTRISAQAPFRRMVTPGGFQMSVAMTNCGSVGWVTDRTGYRYDPRDPDSGAPWPAMPDVFLALARDAAERSGLRRLRARRLPDQLLRARHTIVVAPGQGRARLRPSRRVGVARPAGHLPVRRAETQRPAPQGAAAARRRRGVGRPLTPRLSRRAGAEGGRASGDWDVDASTSPSGRLSRDMGCMSS